MSSRSTVPRWMKSWVTLLFAGLLGLIALADPLPVRRIDVQIIEVSPTVSYRIERHWRLTPDFDARCETAYQDILDGLSEVVVEFPPRSVRRRKKVDSAWDGMRAQVDSAYDGIRAQADSAWDGIAARWQAYQMRRRSDHLQYEAAFNWPLCDLGISRNGQPLRLPPDLANAVMQHQIRNHAMLAAWPWFAYHDPAHWADGGGAVYESMLGNIRWLPQDAGINVSHCGDLEMLIVPPYLLMVRDGNVVGVVGGDGHFDRIPAEWGYLR